jgi:hypothetical protein
MLLVRRRVMGGRREPNEYDLIWLIKHGREWVENLQDRYRPLAHPLPGPLKGTLAPFFPAAILDRVQIAEVGVIQNPPFRDEAIDRGIPPNAIDFTQMEGFTLHDVVLVSMQPKPDQDPEALVFHELVHVVQYDLLGGVEEFMRRYVYGMRGAGWVYGMIPLEAMAYGYQDVFQNDKQTPFPVDQLARELLFVPQG